MLSTLPNKVSRIDTCGSDLEGNTLNTVRSAYMHAEVGIFNHRQSTSAATSKLINPMKPNFGHWSSSVAGMLDSIVPCWTP